MCAPFYALVQVSDSAKRLKDLVENERKGTRTTKDVVEDSQECQTVFKDF